MLTVAEAIAAILAELRPLPPVRLPLEVALGLVLAEEAISDSDSPPFDKAVMDGYAVRAADVSDGSATLQVIEEVTAGRVPQIPVGPGQATQIMTGAPLPEGADAVVRVEDTRSDNVARTVHISTRPVSPGDCVMYRGTAMSRGDCVLPAGRRLRAQELGALAELGMHTVAVHPRPRVAILATGDELVPISQRPGPGQIRNSNETMLSAQIRQFGAEPVPLGVARDERTHLREKILAGLECDLLVLAGGVSAGKLDLVPSEFNAAGLRQVFHKIHMKPGKPIWFGIPEAARTTPLRLPQGLAPRGELPQAHTACGGFGLPGNPVSSMVCCELFVGTAIRRLMGIEPAEPRVLRASLVERFEMRGDRPTYHPAHLEWTGAGLQVRPVRWHGSSDLRATVESNAMALFPAGERTYAAGDVVDVFRFGESAAD